MRATTRSMAAVLVTAALLVACSDDDEDTAAEAADVCDSVEVLVGEARSVGELSASSTVEDLQGARDAMQDAVDNLVDERGDLAEARVEEARDAFDAFNEEIDGIDDQDTIAEALPQVRTALENLQQAADQLAAESTCTISATTTTSG